MTSDSETLDLKNLKLEPKSLSDSELTRKEPLDLERRKKYTKKIEKVRENPKKETIIDLNTIFKELNLNKNDQKKKSVTTEMKKLRLSL